MSEKKPEPRVLELEVEIEAPIEQVWKAISEGAHVAGWFAPEARVTGEGESRELGVRWPEMSEAWWSSRIAVWKPNEQLRLVDDSGMLGPGTSIWVEYFLTTEKGRTRLRLVQSGFGESAGWEEFFEGTEAGWSYFLCNLRLYVQRHFGRARQMLNQRFEVTLGREVAWGRVLGAAGGLVVAGGTALQTGSVVGLSLGGAAPAKGVIEVLKPQRVVAFRIAELDDAMLLVELESGEESFHLGLWMSVYDASTASRLRKPVLAQYSVLRSNLASD